MTEETSSLVQCESSICNNDSASCELQVAQSVFIDRPITGERFINGADGIVYGKITQILAPPLADATCWYCRQGDPVGELYKPCACDSLIHRNCLRKWRTGWINPRNYFSCPNCMHSYNLEQVRPPTTESKERMVAAYRTAVIKVWACVLLGFAAVVAILAGISYGCDTSDKNIPVAVRCLLTSVVGGFPNSNSTTQWREDFKLPNVAVWPYYSAFGLFLTSVLIIVSFVALGSSFKESDRRRTNHCSCVDDCCSGSTNGLYVWVAPDNCCNSCNCVIDGNGCHGGSCGGCSGGGGGNCDVGDVGALIALIIIVIVVIVIFSAIVVTAMFAVQKCSLLYDRLTAMLASQQSELEGETVVLGVGESWLPNDAV